MIASELALELGITPSVMSKRLKTYCQEAETELNGLHLPEKVVADMRQVNKLLESKTDLTTLRAIHIALGYIDTPVPPRSAQELAKRMDKLEDSLQRVNSKVDRLLEILEEELRQRQY